MRASGVSRGAQRDLGIPAFTRAHGAFELSWADAVRGAELTLAQIDFSRRDIVIYAPGTGSNEMYAPLGNALTGAFTKAGRGFSVGTLKYEAGVNLRRSVPTGIAMLRLVLAAIAAHPGDHRVTLVGISQGAWIGAEILADPSYRRMIDRAALVARPSLSLHRFDRGEDPGVIEVAHPRDFAVRQGKGDPTRGLDATIALFSKGPLGALPALARAIATDPGLLGPLLHVLMLQTPVLRRLVGNPHDYRREMPFIAAYLAGAALGRP